MEIDAKDMLNTLAEQRNNALDAVVSLTAQLKAIQREVDLLNQQLAGHESADPTHPA